MGGLTPALEALAGKLTRGASRDRQPASPARSRAEAPESGGDPVTADLDLTKVLLMPLDQFAREGQLLEVRVVPWLNVTLWFVPEERDAEAFGREDVGRGRIWTAGELSALMALPDRTPEIVQGQARTRWGNRRGAAAMTGPNGRRHPGGSGGTGPSRGTARGRSRREEQPAGKESRRTESRVLRLWSGPPSPQTELSLPPAETIRPSAPRPDLAKCSRVEPVQEWLSWCPADVNYRARGLPRRGVACVRAP